MAIGGGPPLASISRMRVVAALVSCVLAISCAGSSSDFDDGGFGSPPLSVAATTPCEDACFEAYLAACAVCARLRLGRRCYEDAMSEYVRCVRRCNEGGG